MKFKPFNARVQLVDEDSLAPSVQPSLECTSAAGTVAWRARRNQGRATAEMKAWTESWRECDRRYV